MRRIFLQAGAFIRKSAAVFLSAGLAFGAGSSPGFSQNVVWEDFGGLERVNPLALQDGRERYRNLTGDPLTVLKAFSSDSSRAIRTGSSSNINYTIASQTLCNIDTDGSGSPNGPSCLIGAMGRVIWARVQFPLAGNYTFSLNHDDQVDIDISSNYQSNNYKGVSYNLPVGGLPSYSQETTRSTLPGTIYAPVNNSCGWIRIYWNNVGGRNHLGLNWTNTSGGPGNPGSTAQVIPAVRYLPVNVTPGAAVCADSVRSSATAVQLTKELGSNNRARPADQFSLAIIDSSNNSVLATAGSGGNTTGMIADTGAVLAQSGRSYILTETMSSGSVSPLSLYNPQLTCTRNGTAFTPTTVSTGRWSVTVGAANEQIYCKVTNQRSLTAPVAVNDVISGQAVGTVVTFSPWTNDTDPGGSGLNNSSITLLTTGQPAGTTLSADGKRLTVPGQGVWQVSANGSTVFTPASGFAGNPTPAAYQIRDNDAQASNVATLTVTYRPVADLAIAKTADNSTPMVGANVTFTLTVTNRGLSEATGVRVTDLLPAGYTWISDTSGGSYDPASGLWTIGTLANGANRVLQIVARVNPEGSYENRAVVTGTEEDPVPGNNTSTVTPRPVQNADLAIEKIVTNATPLVSSEVTFTLNLQNNGPSRATSVRVSDPLPAGYTWVSDSSGGSYDTATGLWTVGEMANGETRSLTITAVVNATGPYLNTAVASATETDPVPANNTSSVTPTPQPKADVVMVKTVDNATPRVGENVVFTLTVTNNGPSPATSVAVADRLPAGYTWISDTGAGAYVPVTGRWSVGTLAVGASRSLAITARVNATGPWLNTATATLTETDSNPPNNTDTSTVTPVPVTDLSVTKSVDNTLPIVGDQVVFTLTARNRGPSDATGVAVTDLLPAGYTFVSATGPGTYTPATGLWAIGALAMDAEARLQITATVTASGPWLNTATITGDQTDPDPSNNTDSVTPGPLPRADVYVTKAASTLTPVVGGQVTFTLTAGNNGLSTATDVVVTDLLPDGMTLIGNPDPAAYNPATGAWTIGTLAAGTQRTLTLTARIEAAGNYTNTATITSGVPDPRTDNNTDRVTLTPVPQIDLSILKSVSNATPLVGQEVVFTLTVNNAGPSPATGVAVTDLLPSGYSYVSHSGPGTYTPATGLWTIGNLPSGTPRVLALTVRVNATGDRLNTATVTGTETDTDPGNNTADATTTPVAQADLVMRKTVSNATPRVGDQVTFTLRVTNTGPSESANTIATDALPAGYTYVSDSATQGSYTPAGGAWDIGLLASGASAELRIVATVNATGPYANTASVSGPVQDPDPGNNTSTVTPSPVPQTDLSVTKSVDRSTPLVGETVVFTLTALNAGPSDASNVVLRDQLPAGYSYVSHLASAGTFTSGTGEWQLGSLANGASASLTLTAVVNPAGPYLNQATITGAEQDPNPGNNTDTETTTPGTAADLQITKVSNSAAPLVGSQVSFTLNVTNNGPSPASSVEVNDLLPSGYTYIGDNSGGAYNRSTGRWTLGTLAAGAGRSLTIEARVNATGDYTNSATVTSPVTDPDPGNNTDTVTPGPLPVSDLAVVKTVDNPTPSVGNEVVFTLSASNNGPSDSTGVQVTDLLPSGYTYLSHSGGTYSPATGLWSIGDLANGASAALTIRATVLSGGQYRNIATITGSGTDPDLSNNTSDVSPSPSSVVDLRVVKSASTLTPTVASEVTFTIEVTNLGPSAASLAEVTDLLPDGFTYVSHQVGSAAHGSYDGASGLWGIGALAMNESATLTVTARVNPTGNYTNIATARSDEADSNPSNNTSSVTLTPVPQADLSITKLTSDQTPDVGSEVTFTLTVGNAGPSEATQVTVRDVLAAGYTYLSHTGPGTYTPGSGLWSLGRVESGGSAALQITARVNPTGPYSNTAEVTGRENDPDPGNNTSTVTPEPEPVTDLAIVKTISNTAPEVGSTISFTLSVTNNGPSAATAVQVTDVLPAGYTYLSAAGSGSSTYTAADGLRWLPGTIPSGASRSLTLTVRVNATGPWANTASVTGAERDPEPGNNTSTVTPGPVPQADLELTKTVDEATPLVGSDVVFTVTVTNNGPSAATGVEITEALPAGYTYRSHTGPGTYSPGAGLWTPGDLANGSSATLLLTAAVNPSGPWANTATARATEEDPIPQNNSDTVTPVPRAQADLVMSKTVSEATPNVGDVITFRLSVTNNGLSTATDVRVTDLLPSGYTYVSDNGSGGYAPATGLWTVGVLARDQSAELEIRARVNASGTYTNTATVTAAEDDPVPGNNTSTVTPGPVPQADVSVVKTASSLTPDAGGEVTFTLTVSNAGPSDASSVVLVDRLPAGYSWISDNSNGAYNPATGNWTLGTLAQGASRLLSITARVNATGPWLNTARVSATEPDPVPGNNTSSVTPAPVAQADLAVRKAVDVATPSVGDTIRFTLNARNNGPSAATSVRVTDLLPDGYTFVSASGTGTYNPFTGIWSPGNLALGAEVSLTISARVEASGTYLNTATITGAEADPDLTNNTASVSPGPLASADLYIDKSVSTTTPLAGQEVTFTLLAGNNGLSDATGVEVTDQLPDGYSLVPMSAVTPPGTTVDVNGNQIRWNIGALPATETRLLEFRAVVNAAGTYRNVARIRGTEPDPDFTNNEDSVTTTPVPVTDLAVTKSVSAATPPVGGTVTFTLNARNNGPSAATGVAVTDLLPAGYRYLSHSGTGSYDPATGLWRIGNLANGASADMAISVQVNADGPWLNTATISGTETGVNNVNDPVPANNTDTSTITPVPRTDLAIRKTVSNAAPAVGSEVTFTLSLSNAGPSDATGVEVTEQLAAGYTFVSATAGTGSYDPVTGLWQVGNLANGASTSLSLIARVNPTGPWTNTATVDGTEDDPVPGNNTSTVTPEPSPRTDLAVTKTVDNSTPDVGDPVVFTLTATNNGPSDATGVTVSDLLPAGYRFLSVTPAQADYNPGTGLWTIGALASGSSRTLDIRAEVRATGPWTNTARISGTETDPVPGNNTDTSTPVPTPVADLALVKSVSEMTPAVGSEVTFRLTLRNDGPSDATTVQVTDQLPAGYTWLSDNSSGSYDPATGLWQVGSLPAGAQRVLSLRVAVNPTGPYTNTAVTTATEDDPVPGNNTSTVTPTPDPRADLVMAKTVSDQTPDMGDTITFTLSVNNLGPSDATSVQVFDQLPRGYQYISDSAGGAYSAATGLWTLGSLPAGQSTSMTIQARVVPGGPYVNTARVSGAETDPRIGNNTDSVAPGPTPRADLQIVKTADSLTPDAGGNITFTLRATNQGPSDATDVVVEDLLPNGYLYLSDDSSGSYVPASGLWSIGALNVGDVRELRITARVNATGDYHNVARIRGAEGDPDISNNTSDVTPVPAPVADLHLVKSVDNPRPPVGSDVVFTLSLTNNGPSEARGVETTDLLPNGYSYVSHTGPGSYNPASGSWVLGSMANGVTAELRITARVLPSTGGAAVTYRNTATVTGSVTDPDPGNNTSEVTPVPELGGLWLDKRADVSELTAPGPVTYTITVRNTGVTTVPRADLTLTDTLTRNGISTNLTPVFTGGDTRGDDLLSPGETWTYEVVYQVSQAEFDSGHRLSNVITASAPQVDPPVTPPPAEVEMRVTPQMEVEKTATLPQRLVAGETVGWTVRVRNTGNISLTTATPVDTLTAFDSTARSLTTGLTFDAAASSTGSTATTLPIGGLQVWTGTSVLTQEDVDAGGLRNLASVTGTPAGGQPPITASDTEEVPIAANAALTLIKTVTPPARLAAGQAADWRIEVRNTGNVTLQAGVPQDVMETFAGTTRGLSTGLVFDAGASSAGATDSLLPVGGLQVWTGTSVLLPEDVAEGGLRNTATVTATPPSGAPLTASDQADLPVALFAAIELEKTATQPATLAPQETVTWTIRVRNTGNVVLAAGVPEDTLTAADGTARSLTTGLVFDAAASSPGATATSLPVNGEQVWTGTSVLTQEDVDVGGLINDARVIATPPAGLPPVQASDRATVTIGSSPSISVVKTGTLPPTVLAGERMTWTIRVENTGNVSLRTPTPTDVFTTTSGEARYLSTPLRFDAAASTGGATAVMIPAGGVQIWTATYVLTNADLDAGGLRNFARVEGTPPGPGAPPVTDQTTTDVPIAFSPSLLLTKTAVLPAQLVPGETITWLITATNNGGVTLLADAPADVLTARDGTARSLSTGLVFDAGRSSGGATSSRLPPSSVQVWTGTSVLTQADIDAGGLNNTATATATPLGGGTPLVRTADAEVPITADPRIAITKTADRSEMTAPGPVTFTISVTNPGNISVAAADLLVTDRMETPLGPVVLTVTGPDPSGDLNGDGRFDPGETWVYEAVYNLTADVLAASGTLRNVARAEVTGGPHPFAPVENLTPVVVDLSPPPGALVLEKIAGVQTAMIGDLVPYTIRLINTGAQNRDVRLSDYLPQDFSLRTDSLRLDGVPVTAEGGARQLHLDMIRLRPGQTRVLTYNTVVGSSARPGNHVNRARAVDPVTGAPLAPDVTATVKVVAEAVFHCATVLGRVFDDIDQNGDMSGNGTERGLPNVRLVAPNGMSFTTDAHGRYNVPCAAMPQAVGSNFMLKLDPRTLPQDYRVTTENPRVVRLTPGMITRLDFGATRARMVRIDLAARAFGRDSAGREVLSPELERGLQALVREILRTPTMVQLTYVAAPGEPEGAISPRLSLVEDRLKSLWHGRGSYKLNIETLIETARAQR